MRANNELSHIAARDVRAFAFDQVAQFEDLARMGICLDTQDVVQMAQALGMDENLTPALTTPSVTTPVQFLQEWLPGFVYILTGARKIDELVGITTQGAWEDEEIVQGVMEHTGKAYPYGDNNNVPLSSWNTNFIRRTIVRFEEGMSVGRLEEKRAARIRVDSAAAKRTASAEALEINRNKIGFFGFNDGANQTYGFLNDPNLPAYVTVPDPGAGTEWVNKDFLEITADVRVWMSALRTQSQDRIDPMADNITLALPTNVVDQLTTTSDFGNSVREWLKENYPNTRIVSAPELNGANGGENVAYVYAETVGGDGSTDDNRTFVQVVPTKFQTLGVEQRAKSYVEDYSNATAGIMTKRPFAVYRATGI